MGDFRECVSSALKNIKEQVRRIFGSDSYTEIRDLQGALIVHLEIIRKSKIEAAKKTYKGVVTFFESNSTVVLPFDLNVMFEGKRRLIAGMIGAGGTGRKKNSESDCCIVAYLARYFTDKQARNIQLMFCSENKSDFGLEMADGRYVFDPNVSEGLPPTELFLDLKSLVEALRQHREVKRPTSAELDEALERTKEKRIDERLDRRSDWIDLEEALADKGQTVSDLQREVARFDHIPDIVLTRISSGYDGKRSPNASHQMGWYLNRVAMAKSSFGEQSAQAQQAEQYVRYLREAEEVAKGLWSKGIWEEAKTFIRLTRDITIP
jgi:hypothetical protein